jgi:hypothetical protein
VEGSSQRKEEVPGALNVLNVNFAALNVNSVVR